MYTRLEPPKDAHGNFMEQAMPLYNLAIKCHKDLENVVQANVKFDAGTSSTVPNVRSADTCCEELLYILILSCMALQRWLAQHCDILCNVEADITHMWCHLYP